MAGTGTMAGRPVDPLQCFTSLTDNLPCWITRVTELAAHTSRKHAEFSEEFQRLARTKLDTEPTPHRRESSSMHSIRPESEGGRDVARPIRPLTIYYDGHSQIELERIVRDIGAVRNSLRKGKMSRTRRISNLPLDMFAGQPRDPSRIVQLPGENLRKPRAAAGPDQETAPFEFADKQLEIAQSLSESAAHQFLRCGDCRKELDQIIAEFNIVFEMAGNEVTRLRADKERETEKQRADESTALAEQMASSMKLSDPVKNDKATTLEIAAIEVDDDAASHSSISIDLTTFRSNRVRG